MKKRTYKATAAVGKKTLTIFIEDESRAGARRQALERLKLTAALYPKKYGGDITVIDVQTTRK